MDTVAPQGRHYGMDWLRIAAFQLLILYHVGMAFVRWDYQVKVVDPPLDWVAIPMLLTNPWRLSLLFLVSGYASAALLRRSGGTGAFVRSRMKRLGVPLLFGMAVIVVPQPWVWLRTHYSYAHGFGWFLLHDYYRPHIDHDVVTPTYMHLWFVVYLMFYTLVLGALLTLPGAWRARARQLAERVLATPLLLPLPILYLYLARSFLAPGWEDSHMFVNDFSAHAAYFAAFLFGYLLRGSEPLRRAIGQWWVVGGVAAILGWSFIAGVELVWPGDAVPPHWIGLCYRIARAIEAWGAIVGLVGLADRHWNVDHRWRPMLAEAVFPFYLVHQTIILVVGYWLLGTATGPLARFATLVAATAAGCWVFYLGGRAIPWLRPLIGLKGRVVTSPPSWGREGPMVRA